MGGPIIDPGMPAETDQGTIAELEAELAKLTDELESECAELEANEDRPIAAVAESVEPDGAGTLPGPEAESGPAPANEAEPAPVSATQAAPEPDPEPAGEAGEAFPELSIDAIAQSIVDADTSASESSDAPTPIESESDPAGGAAPETGEDAGLDGALRSLLETSDIDAAPADGWNEEPPSEAPPIDLGDRPVKPVEADASEDEPSEEREPVGWEPPDAVGQVEAIDRNLADLTAQLMDGERADAETAPTAAGDAPEAPPPPSERAPAKTAAARAGAIGAVAIKNATPAAKAAARYTAIAARHTARVAGPPAKAAGMHAARAAAPLGARVLLLASKPIADKPETVRSSIGWLAMGTAFVAVVTWFFVLVRTPGAPAPAEAPSSIRAEGDPPALPAVETQASAPASGSGSGT